MSENNAVEGPVPFNPPHLNQCSIQLRRVMGADNRIIERPCLVSESGRFYEIGRFIRKTIFGHVSHGLELRASPAGDILVRLDPPAHIAIKVYLQSKLVELRGRTQENPFKEMAAMQHITNSGGHLNIIHNIECCIDSERVYSIMEFLDTELYDIVESSGPCNEGLARFYFRQIVLGLQYLHSLPMSHRDMSLENVLVNKRGLCKIIDLGMCLRVARLSNNQVALMPSQGQCGKKNYIAPEVLANLTPFQPLLVDIWALGVMLFILVTGVPPMDVASGVDERYRMVFRGQLRLLLEQWGFTLSPSLVDLMTMILRPQPLLRPSIEAILAHEWMQLPDSPPASAEDAMVLNIV
jgi:serine/threonine protein kinase